MMIAYARISDLRKTTNGMRSLTVICTLFSAFFKTLNEKANKIIIVLIPVKH